MHDCYYIITVLSLQQPAVSRGKTLRSDLPNHSFTSRALSHFSSNIYNPETEAPRPFFTCLDSLSSNYWSALSGS